MPDTPPLPKSRVYLGIDSATSYLALALWSPDKGLLAKHALELGREHAKQILPALDTLLNEAGIQKTHLAGIGVGAGPGSYTGLRVGLATAQGLARALGIPLSSHSSLAAIAFSVLREGERGVITLDARRGNVYAGVFEHRGDSVHGVGEIARRAKTDVVRDAKSMRVFEDGVPDAEFLARFAWLRPGEQQATLYL